MNLDYVIRNVYFLGSNKKKYHISSSVCVNYNIDISSK